MNGLKLTESAWNANRNFKGVALIRLFEVKVLYLLQAHSEGGKMYIEWNERRARRTQLIKLATAIIATIIVAAIPVIVVGIRIGL